MPRWVGTYPPEPAWLRVYHAFQHDIVNHRYAPGAVLPSPSLLCDTYGICRQTLRKVLARLAREGAVEQWKRQYRIVVPRSSVPSGSLLLVASGSTDGTIWPLTPRTEPFLAAMEKSCIRSRLDLRAYRNGPPIAWR